MKAEWEMDRESANDSYPLIEKDKLLDSMGDVGSTSAGEIRDEEVEANSAACCRICLEYDSEPGDILISIRKDYIFGEVWSVELGTCITNSVSIC